MRRWVGTETGRQTCGKRALRVGISVIVHTLSSEFQGRFQVKS